MFMSLQTVPSQCSFNMHGPVDQREQQNQNLGKQQHHRLQKISDIEEGKYHSSPAQHEVSEFTVDSQAGFQAGFLRSEANEAAFAAEVQDWYW